VLALAPGLSLASVGKVSVLEGTARRVPKEGGAPVALQVGSEIELGDTLQVVGKQSNLKLALNDSSVLMVGADSELVIKEAQFQSLERSGFSAKLTFGKIWAKVTRAIAGSDSKFEVSTERAVAGVRGTIFRVDAMKLLNAVKPQKTTVSVAEGKVAVAAQLPARPPPAPPPAGSGKSKVRTQVAGPTEVSKKQWEDAFVELQARQRVVIGEELATEDWDPAKDDDDFAQFVRRNQ
jgi:hypothetical protein